MSIFTNIIVTIADKLESIHEFFWMLFDTTKDWPWPFSYVHEIFWSIGQSFAFLRLYFLEFNEWVQAISVAIQDVATIENIQIFFGDVFNAATDAWSWVVNAWDNVTAIVGEWWQAARVEIDGLINSLSLRLNSLQASWNDFWNTTFPQWTNILDTLRAAWDEFWTDTFPNLVSFTWLTTWWNTKLEEIGSLIDSRIAVLSELLDAWEYLKNQIVDFFSDPLEWLWQRFADWFLGPEG